MKEDYQGVAAAAPDAVTDEPPQEQPNRQPQETADEDPLVHEEDVSGPPPAASATAANEPPAVASDSQSLLLMEQFEQAIFELSDDDKEAYLEALQAAPSAVIKSESDPSKFLRMHGSDPKAAAEGLAAYWDNRQMIFGDRAFRPLKLLSEGTKDNEEESALGAEAGTVLASGAALTLRNESAASSAAGRSVLYFNGTGMEFGGASNSLSAAGADAESYYRACFFLFQQASDNPLSQTEGADVIVTEPCPMYVYEMLVGSGVPLRIHQLHVLFLHGGENGDSKGAEAVKSRIRRAVGEENREKVQFHVIEPGSGPPQALIDLAVTREMMPTVAIGTKPKSEKRRASADSAAASSNAKVPKQDEGMALDRIVGQEEAEADSTAVQKPQSARRKMLEGIRLEVGRAVDALDDRDKAAYLEAQGQVPHLVRKEADPVFFYRHHDSNAAEAAKMLVAYWSERVKIFSTRAMFPMSQTGEGAMTRHDVLSLNSGVFFNLPSDSSGNPVVFYDHSKVTEMSRDIQRETLPKLAFYMLSVAAETARLQKAKGITLLLPLQNLDSTSSSAAAAGVPYSFKDILAVLPVRVMSVHAFTVQPHNKTASVLSSFARATVGEHHPSGQLFAHPVFSRQDAIRALESFGMPRAGLPKSIGGQWGIERFVEWTELRTRFEWNLPPAASHKGIEKVFDFSGLKQPSKLSEEERIERSRRMNVLHSRRKREREKVEIGVLNEHVDELRTTKEHLLREKQRLQGVLQAARMQVEMIERGQVEVPSSAPPAQAPPPSPGHTINEVQMQGGPKPAVQRLLDQPDSIPAHSQPIAAPFPGQVMLGSVSEQSQHSHQQQQQGYLFQGGGAPPGTVMVFPQAANQGPRPPQDNSYIQVHGVPAHYGADQTQTVQFAMSQQPPMAAVAPQQWQPQVYAAPPPQAYGAPAPQPYGAPPPQTHSQQPQQQQQPQFVVQVQPYHLSQPMGYVVPSMVMSSSGPHNMNLADPSSGTGYFFVGGDSQQQQQQQGHPPPL